jgi:hypothetical protein
MKVQGVSVVNKSYKETLELIRKAARPLTITFIRQTIDSEVLQGYCFLGKGPFFQSANHLNEFKRRYFVVGGPIAKKNILQLYSSKHAYHETVVSLFRKQTLIHSVKTYPLTYDFKVSTLDKRHLDGISVPLWVFSFMTPSATFKSIRVALENSKNAKELYTTMKKFAGKSL